jgi:hypothetical protein
MWFCPSKFAPGLWWNHLASWRSRKTQRPSWLSGKCVSKACRGAAPLYVFARILCVFWYAYVCVYIYTHMFVCVYIFTYRHIYLYIYACVCVCTYVYIYIHIDIYRFMYAYMYLYTCLLFLFLYLFIHVSICIYICLWCFWSVHTSMILNGPQW